MYKYFLSTLILICTVHSYSAIPIPIKDTAANRRFISLGPGISLSLADYILLKGSDFKKLTGCKLNWKEAMAFKIAKKKIKKVVKKDGTADMLALDKRPKKPFKWNWGGFFLGLLLPVLGLIITAFFKDEQRKSRIDSAGIGACIFGIVFLAIVLSSF